MQGSTVCVYGEIASIDSLSSIYSAAGYNDETKLRFGNSSQFYISSGKPKHFYAKGDCIFTEGEILISNTNVLYIKPSDIYDCESWMK